MNFDPRRRALLRLLGAAALLPGCDRSRSPSGILTPAGGGAPTRVLIVGAGIAGLTAANALRNAGVECVIIEGRERIGGRLWTRDLGGTPIDFGGSWIHDPDGNPMSDFADRAGVARKPVDPIANLLSIRAYDEKQQRLLLKPETLEAFTGYAGFEESANLWLQQLGDQASVKDGIEAFMAVAGAAMLPEQKARATHVARFVHETFDASDWGDISLNYLVNSPIDEYGGSEFGDFPVGGYTTLVQAMAAGADVRLGHRVTRIEHGGGTAVVHTEHAGQAVSFSGSHVLVTVSLGVLKGGAIQFDPPLPERKQQAIANIGFGHFEKVAMKFDTPFWEGTQLEPRTHFYFISADAQQPMEFPFFLDLQKGLGEPVLVGLTSGNFALQFAEMGEDAIRTRVMQVLREAYGSSVPDPAAMLISGWSKDPYALGSYSYLAVNSSPDDMDALAEPASERLLFAGEASYKLRYGYADGSLSSGLREARRLLGTDNVTITPG